MEESKEILVNQTAEIAEKSNDFLDKGRFEMVARTANMFSKSTIVPENYRGKPADCMIAVDMASRMGVSPIMVMQNLYVVKGKPSWSGQACMSLIQGSGRFENVHHVYFGEVGKETRGCYVEATRVGDGTIIKGAEVTMAMAKAENWTTNAKWRNMPELMLAYRAAAFFAKVNCPDILMGVQTIDEVIDSEPKKKIVEDVLK